jgi:imidazolonepropionase-like amidohydrolase
MLAIVGARIHTRGPQGTVDDGTVLVRDGKIAALGVGIEVPEGAGRIDARGMVMTPGFVDAHTHMGMAWQELAGEADTNESTTVINAHLRAIDSIDPKDIAFQDAVEGGVTTVMVHPGKLMIWRQTISPIAGQSVVLKTRGTIGHREVLREPAGLKLAFGDEVAEFLNARKVGPNSRMGIMALVRGVLHEAQQYAQKDTGGNSGARDLKMEILSRLLSRELKAYVHVHAASDILSVLRLAEEYDLDIVLEHATEGHMVADTLAEKGVPCVVGPITRARSSRLKREMQNLSQKTPGILANAGVKVALMTDHPTEPIQFLPIIAGEAAREGMDYDEALKSITINAAEIMGVADRVGSIEVGKDADLVVLDGDPLEAMTRIRLVVADGEMAYDAMRPGKEME